jgi:Glycosyl transferase family 2
MLCAQRGWVQAVPEDLTSFVVIAYNEEAGIARSLGAITELDGLANYEIVVVDDASRDRTAEIVTALSVSDPRVRLIKLPENRGRGHARWRGATAARGHLIAMVDADIRLPCDWLVKALAALPGHDAVGGTAVPDGDVAYICKRFHLVPRVTLGPIAVTGNNGLFRRAVFDVVHYDPTLRDGEDVALCHAMASHHLSAALVPGLLVRHEEHKTFRESLAWLFASGQGATRQLLTFREVRQPDLVTGAFLGTVAVGLVLAFVAQPLLAVGLPAAFTVAAAARHTSSRFDLARSPWHVTVRAMAVDGVLLLAYFSGRIAGLRVLSNRRRLGLRAAETAQPYDV